MKDEIPDWTYTSHPLVVPGMAYQEWYRKKRREDAQHQNPFEKISPDSRLVDPKAFSD